MNPEILLQMSICPKTSIGKLESLSDFNDYNSRKKHIIGLVYARKVSTHIIATVISSSTYIDTSVKRAQEVSPPYHENSF